MLEVARRGEYEMIAIGRGLSPERQKQFFSASANGGWQIKPQIKSMVEFKELNLLERYLLGKFDIILCRNVLIYFSADLKKDILTRLHGSLNPGGYLILGASESLNGLSHLYEMVQSSGYHLLQEVTRYAAQCVDSGGCTGSGHVYCTVYCLSAVFRAACLPRRGWRRCRWGWWWWEPCWPSSPPRH